MVLSTPTAINDALEERVGSTRIFSTATKAYSSISNEIASIQLDLANQKLPDLKIEELKKLKQDLINKYSTAKTQIDHSKLAFENLVNENQSLGTYYSQDSISHRKADLFKKFLASKKRIEELTRKQVEIKDINRTIESFNRNQDLVYTSDELDAIFGDESEAIKNSPGVLKRTALVKVEKENVDVDMDSDDKKKESNGNENGNGNGVETDDEVKESTPIFEEKEITKYTFRAHLGNSVDRLREIQDNLQASITQFEKEIREIKNDYIEDVKKFEAIRKIVGYEDESKDVEMKDDKDEEPEQEQELDAPVVQVVQDHDNDHETNGTDNEDHDHNNDSDHSDDEDALYNE